MNSLQLPHEAPGVDSEGLPTREALRLALAFALRSSRNHADAEDLAQEAVFRWLLNRHRVRRPAPWFAVVVRRLARRSGANRPDTTRQRPEFASDGHVGQDPEGDRIDALTLEALLTRLPPARRTLLELYLAGCTHREIAEQLGCKVHQVGPRLARVIATLRSFLNHHPGYKRPSI